MPKPTKTSSISTEPSSKRASNQRQRWIKQLQLILGPRLATRRNLVLCIASLQTVVLVFLYLALNARSQAIKELRSPSTGYPLTQYGAWDQKKSFTEERQITTMDTQSAQSTEPKQRRFGLFGGSRDCKPQPCSIDHWSPSEDACFFREDYVKDRRGHNSTVWSLVQNEWYYTEKSDFACPAVVCRKQWLSELNLTKSLAYTVLDEHYKNDTEWELVDLTLGNIFMRVNPFWGLEYKMNSLLSLRKHGDVRTSVSFTKRASVTLRRGFTQKFCDVALNDNILPDEDPIYVIVPYTGRADMLRRFFLNVGRLLDEGVNMRVVLSIFGGEVHVQGAQLLLNQLDANITVGNLSDGNIIQIVESRGDKIGNFSRAQALHEGAAHVPQEGLLFFCDVDVEIHKEFFNNCRFNTEKGRQIYFPVLYSLYPYGTTVSREHGYWRSGAYGMLCVYNSDFSSRFVWATEYRRKKLVGWGQEDIVLYSEFNDVWSYTIFRSVEPNLLHQWHPQVCDFNENMAACLDTVLNNMGTQAFVASLIANEGIDVRTESYVPEQIDFEEYKNDTVGDEARKYDMPLPESESDKAKFAQLISFYSTGIQKSNPDRLLQYLSERALMILERITAKRNADPQG